MLVDVDWIARAKELRPLIEAAVPSIEAEGRLPSALDDALHEAGMYRLLIPRSCNGMEIDSLTYAQVMEELASADASVAWCVGQVTACAMSAAYIELDAAQEIFGAPRTVLAWGPPAPGSTNRAVAVEGGYRVTATWQFASGSRQADWLGGVVPIVEGDGTPRESADGKPVVRTVLFPKADATITDLWQVVGLRGTGSDQYAIDGLFVPEKRAFVRDRLGWREPGPLYRLSMVYLHAVAFGAVALGIARAMLDSFVDLARHKRSRRGTGQSLRESTAVQGRIGLAHARLNAARAYLHAATRRGWEEAATIREGEISLQARIETRAASTFAILEAEKVVDIAYRLAGAEAIFDRLPFERRFRDMHAVTQQVQGHLSNFETIGQYRLGEPMELVM